MAFVTSNGEVATADDAGLLQGMASAFDLAGVARVELDRAWSAVSLEKLHADDRRASVENELANDGGFVHGEEGK